MLDTEDIIGVEALARWTHPRLGAIGPSTFIPIAEESGDIITIGAWVIREACRSIAAIDHLTAKDPIYVSVNVSPHQLLRSDFAEHVQATLSETGLSAERLRLEITEGSIVRDRAHASGQLQRLRDIGVKICVDDFGTGHSSLAYVHDLPLDGIKIDRSFVNRLTSTENADHHLVRTVLDLAHHIGLNVVAEGIETRGQKDALLRLSCAYGQGYLFDRPLPLAALEERLDDFVEQLSS